MEYKHFHNETINDKKKNHKINLFGLQIEQVLWKHCPKMCKAATLIMITAMLFLYRRHQRVHMFLDKLIT